MRITRIVNLVAASIKAQMKEEKKLYKMMKKNFFLGGVDVGKGSNFTLKFFDIFEIVKYVAFREYNVLFRFFLQRYSLLANKSNLIKKICEKKFFGVKLHKKLQKIEIL